MRIGIDASCWSNGRGYGRFTRALLSALLRIDSENRYFFFIDEEPEQFPLPDGVEVVHVAAQVPATKAASANGHRSLADLWAAGRSLGGHALDLLFFPSVYTYAPVLSRVPKIVTVHDAIPELFPELVFPTLRSRLFWGAKMKLGCAQARLILTVSEYSRRCLMERLKLPRERLRVVHEASDPVFRRLQGLDNREFFSRWHLPGDARLLAYVGGFSPHKNLPMLLDVFRDLKTEPRFGNLHLVLAGDYTGDVFYSCYRQLVDQVERYDLQEHVWFTGHLSDEDMVTLLNLAEAVVLPSFSEGFGLPAVEAAACGTAVIATSRSPLPDLLGEGVIAVEPEDRAGWRRAITRVLVDGELQARMKVAGMKAASGLSWENSACQLLSIFEEVGRTRVASA